MNSSTKTLCPYCGVGCGLEVIAQTPSSKVRGDRSHPSSQGMVCVKGATILESIKKDRLLYPLFRESLGDNFRRISWDEALEKITDRINVVKHTIGAQGICMYGSGQFQTEDYYVAQKLIKGCIGTNNFDANSRLCMSSAVSGYVKSLGADGPPCCYDDLELTDCCFIIGSNTAECHPIVFNRFRKYHRHHPHVQLVVVDPRKTPTAAEADLYLAIRPGTDIDLMNGIGYLLLQWGAIDREFIQQHTDGFDQFSTIVQGYTPERVGQTCGISPAELEQAAKIWADSHRVLSLWSMGINQSAEGTAKVQSIINLHLLSGQIGKPGAGPFSLTGQPNAMGGREAGGLSHLLPGYRFVTNPDHRRTVETYWQLPPGSISPDRGHTAWDIVRGLEQGAIGFLWIAATNPAVSFPDLERTKKALRASPFTVYQDCYFPTETTTFAHLLLPSTQWSEKTGVMTNSERRVTYCHGFEQPMGEARHDWEIFAAVGRKLGFSQQFSFQSSAEVYQEFVQLTRGRPCDQSDFTHDRLMSGALQWGGPRLYTDRQFHTPNGRAQFAGYHSRGLAEPIDGEYPFVLTTGRLYGHWHTLTRTGRIDKIQQMHPHPFIEIHPRDAQKLSIADQEMVEVRSRRGRAIFPALVTEAISPGTVFVPMHWGALWAEEAEANALTHPECCPDSFQPELKACAVNLQKTTS